MQMLLDANLGRHLHVHTFGSRFVPSGSSLERADPILLCSPGATRLSLGVCLGAGRENGARE